MDTRNIREADGHADTIISAMIVTVIGAAVIPAHVNWAITASAMGVGVVGIGLCYGVQLTQDEAWMLTKQFIKAAGFWFTAMAVGTKLMSALLETTGIGYAPAVVLDAAFSVAIANAVGETAKTYFKGTRDQKELGKTFRQSFNRKEKEGLG